jgi:hypothetical protein
MAELRGLMDGHGVPFRDLGVVGGDSIRIGAVVAVHLDDARAAYEGALLNAAGSPEVDAHRGSAGAPSEPARA